MGGVCCKDRTVWTSSEVYNSPLGTPKNVISTQTPSNENEYDDSLFYS